MRDIITSITACVLVVCWSIVAGMAIIGEVVQDNDCVSLPPTMTCACTERPLPIKTLPTLSECEAVILDEAKRIERVTLREKINKTEQSIVIIQWAQFFEGLEMLPKEYIKNVLSAVFTGKQL